MPNSAIFARSIHTLKNQQQGITVGCVVKILQSTQLGNMFSQNFMIPLLWITKWLLQRQPFLKIDFYSRATDLFGQVSLPSENVVCEVIQNSPQQIEYLKVMNQDFLSNRSKPLKLEDKLYIEGRVVARHSGIRLESEHKLCRSRHEREDRLNKRATPQGSGRADRPAL